MSDQDTNKETPFAKPTEAEKKAIAAEKRKAKAAAKKAANTAPDLTKLKVVVINADGSDSDQEFQITKLTSSSIIMKAVVPDERNIIINGVTIALDLTKLRKMSPDATLHGKPVSLLIAAAELA